MVLGNPLLRTDVTEHVQLLLVFSAHAFFLSGCAVETRGFSGTGSFGLISLQTGAVERWLENLAPEPASTASDSSGTGLHIADSEIVFMPTVIPAAKRP